MMNLLRYLDTSAPTIVVVPDQKNSHMEQIQAALSAHFSAHIVSLWKMGPDFPLEKDKVVIQDTTTVYICRQNKCEAPLTKIDEIVKSIERV
jgi:uncharacterized protein YyaL (SSP411 family)